MEEVSVFQVMAKIKQLNPQWSYRRYSIGAGHYEDIESGTNTPDGLVAIRICSSSMYDRDFAAFRISLEITCDGRRLFYGEYGSRFEPEEYAHVMAYFNPYRIAQREREERERIAKEAEAENLKRNFFNR